MAFAGCYAVSSSVRWVVWVRVVEKESGYFGVVFELGVHSESPNYLGYVKCIVYGVFALPADHLSESFSKSVCEHRVEVLKVDSD